MQRVSRPDSGNTARTAVGSCRECSAHLLPDPRADLDDVAVETSPWRRFRRSIHSFPARSVDWLSGGPPQWHTRTSWACHSGSPPLSPSQGRWETADLEHGRATRARWSSAGPPTSGPVSLT
eukprot:5093418-Prymnesium_polylepis.1